MQENTVLSYINALVGFFKDLLLPGVSIMCNAYCYNGGGVVRIQLSKGGRMEVLCTYVETPEDAFREINLERFIDADFKGIHFSGTNIIANGDEIILIKDDDPKEWSKEAAKKDIVRYLKGGNNG